jgi:purine-cytosine permease-like protein
MTDYHHNYTPGLFLLIGMVTFITTVLIRGWWMRRRNTRAAIAKIKEWAASIPASTREVSR